MTVVPLSYQLCGWIPAWWRGAAGGDDLLELVGEAAVSELGALRGRVVALTAYSPELGVSALPGPKRATEAAVAAGQAVILHTGPGTASQLLLPEGSSWHLIRAGVPRPVDLDLRTAAADFAQAVVGAEHALRENGATFAAEVRPMTVRPLPPDADPERKGLLVRAVRVWSAVAALPVDERTPELQEVLAASARAALAAYTEPVVTSASRTRRFA